MASIILITIGIKGNEISNQCLPHASDPMSKEIWIMQIYSLPSCISSDALNHLPRRIFCTILHTIKIDLSLFMDQLEVDQK